MHTTAPLIIDLAIMLGIASIITLFFQRIKQPVVLGYLIAGIIIGPYTPPHILVNDIPNIKILSELGVIFLIFSLGLEFSFHKLVRVGFSATFTGLFEVFFMTLIGYSLGRLMGWSFNNALFLGAALSISSTTIIIKAIEELDLIKKRFAELIFGILITEDLLAILLLVLLSSIILSQEYFSIKMLWVTGKLILVIGGWFIVGYFLVPILHKKVIPYANDESITIVAVSLCLLLVSLASHLQYSVALGAFVMGSILAETNSVHRIRLLIKPIRDIFAAVFFIGTGMLMDPSIVLKNWEIILIITSVTIVGKIISTGLSAFFSGQSINTSLRVGFSMAQIGEFSFIIIGLGITLKAIDEALFPIVVSVSVITTFTTPYLIRLSGYLVNRLDKNLSSNQKQHLVKYSLILHRLFLIKHLKQINLLNFRLLTNGIIIAIIFILSYQILVPWFSIFLINKFLSTNICWFIAMLLSVPFLWGILFGAEKPKNKDSIDYLTLPFITSALFTFIEIFMLTFMFFKSITTTLLLLIFMLIFIIIFYDKIGKTYFWFEKIFKTNVQKSRFKLRK